MYRWLSSLAARPAFWLALAGFGLLLQLIGLYYQYGLDYGPCVLCIHVRMWLALLMVLCLAAAALCRWRSPRVVLLLGSIAICAALTERAWQLVATERGWVIGSCDMTSGLPEWIPLEAWFPSVFLIHESCGYTPVMPWALTMGESLLGLFALMVLGLAVLLPGALRARPGAT